VITDGLDLTVRCSPCNMLFTQCCCNIFSYHIGCLFASMRYCKAYHIKFYLVY